jgi:hypothetical protein
MANQLGYPGISPRSHSQHMRHSHYARRRGKQFKAFLAAEATRLSSTSANIFESLTENTAARIRNTDTFAHLVP